MTCIVGLVEGGAVYMGGDSAAVYDGNYELVPLAEPKVHRNGDYLIGICGSGRVGQVIQHVAELPPPPRDPSDLHRFMCGKFVSAIRSALLDAGALGTANLTEDRMVDSSIMIGVEGCLFTMDDDFGVLDVARPFWAIGCGELLALGALHACSKKLKPRARVRLALEAAAEYSAGVSAPFSIKVLR